MGNSEAFSICRVSADSNSNSGNFSMTGSEEGDWRQSNNHGTFWHCAVSSQYLIPLQFIVLLLQSRKCWPIRITTEVKLRNIYKNITGPIRKYPTYRFRRLLIWKCAVMILSCIRLHNLHKLYNPYISESGTQYMASASGTNLRLRLKIFQCLDKTFSCHHQV